MSHYDLFVIGAGSGGLAASKRASQYGAKVGIAEGDLIGGTCVIRGCVPKKLLVYGSQFGKLLQVARDYGWQVQDQGCHWPELIARVQAEVHRLSELHVSFLEKNRVQICPGFARFVDPHTVEVNNQRITADRFLIAVGGEALRPDIPGAELGITSREFFHLPKQPRRVAIIGGGYIGVEFAGILHGLGSEVTQIIRKESILRGFDADLRQTVQEQMQNKGVRFITQSRCQRIEKQADALRLTLTDASDQESHLETDCVIFAIGRRPLVKELGLDAAGVRHSSLAIEVATDSATSQPHIYAVGDCTNRANLTPVAIAEGRAFADTVFGHKPHAVDHRMIPSAVFSQPEAASVGLSEEEARALYGEQIRIHRARFNPLMYNFCKDREPIMMKLVVEDATDVVLGAHMVGKDAAEIIQGIAIPITMGATKADFDRTMAIHPSTAEEFVTMT